MNRFFRGAGQPVLGTGVNTYRPAAPTYYPQPYALPSVNTAPQNPMQTMLPNQTNIIWVDNENEIAAYPSGRGWQQWFGDKNNQILYVRDTDANGNAQPIVKLRYEVLESSGPTTSEAAQEPTPAQAASETVKMPAYDGPSREEFDKLSSSVALMLDKLGDLLK